MFEAQEGLKWWHFNQNNSGGYFIQNEDVLEDVYIQAPNAGEAARIAEDIFSDYSAYCECCGERWSTYWLDEGQDSPSRYGEPINECKASWFHKQCVLYYFDGTRRYYKYDEGFIPFNELEFED